LDKRKKFEVRGRRGVGRGWCPRKRKNVWWTEKDTSNRDEVGRVGRGEKGRIYRDWARRAAGGEAKKAKKKGS